MVVKLLRQQSLLFLAYGLSALAAVALTRFDGGVAFLWASTAILIAALLRTRPRDWWKPLAACGSASFLVTGFFGFGWAASIPLVAINLAEGLVAALLFRRLADPTEPMQSLDWFFRFVAVVGIAAPLAASIPAALLVSALGKSGTQAFVNYFAGHALGNLAFTPLALLVTGRKAQRDTTRELRRKWLDVLLVTALIIGTCLLVFSQDRLPLLFLPVMVVVLAAFRAGRAGAAVAVALVALIGGAATVTGHGPVQLFDTSPGRDLQFFQFFLAATVMTVLPVSADLHNRRRILHRLRVSEERFRLLAEHSSDILMHLNPRGEILYVSPSIRELGGYDPDALVGRYSGDLIVPEHRDHVREQHRLTMNEPDRPRSFEYEALTASGPRWFETHLRAIADEDDVVLGTISIIRDVSQRKATETSLIYAARTDTLTGLPNRRAFREAVDTRRSSKGDCVAVFDIDHFKRVNDRYGHGAGDAVLRSFAAIARCALRKGDLIARLGGEEFGVLLPDTTLEQAMTVCERVRRDVAVARTFVPGQVIGVTVSGGVARIDEGGFAAALKIADAALYAAKNGGRDRLAAAA
jgi:diguanylate cyclase (GGDEF)-like protein/PAS domain S-box-containing protein